MKYIYNQIHTFSINSLSDLPKLRKKLEVFQLKPNYSELSRMLKCDRRTVKRHYEEGHPKQTRKKTSIIDDYYDIISELLSEDTPQKFFYKQVLWQYLTDEYGLKVSPSTFRHYIANKPEFQSYFDRKQVSPSHTHTIRYETAPAEQAQLDWKENIHFQLEDGQTECCNILLLTLGYSRFKLAKVTRDRTQATLQDALTEMFEELGGVPHTILTDNMKTIMSEPRLVGRPGVVHPKMDAFAKDFGFTFKPCLARRPQTKGKVESQMKILDGIHAYQGEVSWNGLEEKVDLLIQRSNMNVSQATRKIPSVMLEKEKESLSPLPKKVIRDSYRIEHQKAKVTKDNLICFRGSYYSVPPKYVAKSMTLKVVDKTLYIYDNTELVAQHPLSKKRYNYLPDHYEAQLQQTIPYLSSEEIKKQAKSNLEKIGAMYDIKD